MEIRENIANNIVELRKKNHWTQAELAEKINYSDKAVSKWERGEAVPEIETLAALASLFNVTVDYFLHEDKAEQKKYKVSKIENLYRKLAVLLLLSLAVIFISLIIFIIGQSKNYDNFWMAFVWTTPVITTLTLIFFALNKVWLGSLISTCLIVISLTACVYFEVVLHIPNFAMSWMIWLFDPLMIGAIILTFFMKKD